MFLDVGAQKFRSYLRMHGKAITLRTRSLGAVDDRGHPAESFTDSTIYADVQEDASSLFQDLIGVRDEVTRIIKVSVDTSIASLDHVIIDGVEYVCKVPDIRTTHIAIRVRQMVAE